MLAAPQQAAKLTSDLTYGASAFTSSMGLWAWLGKNADLVGAVCALIGVVIGLCTFFMTLYYKHKTMKIMINKNK